LFFSKSGFGEITNTFVPYVFAIFLIVGVEQIKSPIEGAVVKKAGNFI
jgi:hypothetical protein